MSCIRLILLLRLRLWNIQIKEQDPIWDSMKAFIIIVHLLTFISGARRAKALSV